MILDDATSEIYYAQLVEAECTADRDGGAAGSDRNERCVLLAVQRSCRTFLCHPEARRASRCEPSHASGTRLTGTRSEDDSRLFAAGAGDDRSATFGTWQGRLPQELRLRGITDREQANEFLRNEYIAEFNDQFAVRRHRKAVRLYESGAKIWTGSSACSMSGR